MIVKIILGGLLIFMVFNLFKAMMIMLRSESTEPMSKYLGRRVLTAAVVLIIVLIAMATGLITPNPRPY